MNRQQVEARDRAIDRLIGLLADVGGDYDVSRDRVTLIVDDIIEAATPGRSEHADAVEQMRKGA